MSNVSTWDEIQERSSERARNYHKFTEPGKIDPHKYCEFSHPQHGYPVIKVGAPNPNYKRFYEFTPTIGDASHDFRDLIEWQKHANDHILRADAWYDDRVKEKISMRAGDVIDTYLGLQDNPYVVLAIYATPDMPCAEVVNDGTTLIFDKERFLTMMDSIRAFLANTLFHMDYLKFVDVEEFGSPLLLKIL